MSCQLTKIFVDLLIISAVSNFNVFKLIEWDPAITYLFKVNTNTRNKCEICFTPFSNFAIVHYEQINAFRGVPS